MGLVRALGRAAFFDLRVAPGLLTKLEACVANAFPRCTYTEAVSILNKAAADDSAKEAQGLSLQWGEDLSTPQVTFLTCALVWLAPSMPVKVAETGYTDD